MSLSIDLSVAIASTRDSFVLTDDTVFTSPARSAYYIYVDAFKMAYDSSVTSTLAVDNTAPNTVTSWTIDYTIDGWYKMYYAAFQAWSVGTTYALYDAVFRTGNVYRSLQAGNVGHDPSDAAWWEVITDPAGLANNKGETNESVNIDSTVYNRVFSADGQFAYDTFISDASTCTDCDEAALLQKYNLFALWLDSIAIADAREEVLDGELIARRIQSTFIDCI